MHLNSVCLILRTILTRKFPNLRYTMHNHYYTPILKFTSSQNAARVYTYYRCAFKNHVLLVPLHDSSHAVCWSGSIHYRRSSNLECFTTSQLGLAHDCKWPYTPRHTCVWKVCDVLRLVCKITLSILARCGLLVNSYSAFVMSSSKDGVLVLHHPPHMWPSVKVA